MVRSFAAALSAALLTQFATTPASAESIDAAAISCQELVETLASTDADTKHGGVVLLAWMSGYLATDDQGTVVDFDSVATDGENVVEYCGKNPKHSVMTAAEKFMGENATPVTEEAIDLAVIKCESLGNVKEHEVEGASVVLMWLAGYHASYDEETMIDLDKLGTDGTKLGKTCGANTQMSLVTASKKVMQQ